LVRAAADRIDAILGAVADSTRALGDTYGRLAGAQGDEGSPDRERWLALRTIPGKTTGLRTWPSDHASPPASQIPYPGFYSFNGGELSDAVLRELDRFGLDRFERLVPTLRSAYESFPFSWVYVTTADEAMMIYPYVPIEEAVNDGTPTKTLYYKAADFGERAVGWTAPYLDLVGAGIDAFVEQVLANIADGDTVRLDMDGQKVLAGQVARAGWAIPCASPALRRQAAVTAPEPPTWSSGTRSGRACPCRSVPSPP
jgi:hypothetical protein